MAQLTIRASAIDSYLECNRYAVAKAYPNLLRERGYQVNETKKYVTPIIGTGIHAGAEYLNKHWMTNHTAPNSDVILAAVEQAVAAFKSGLLRDMETADVSYTAAFPDLPAIRSHITEYVNLYATVILPTRNVEVCEPSFKIQINDNFVLSGHPDSFGDNTVFDLKSGDKVTAAFGQVGVYAYLLSNAGYKVKNAQLDYIRRPKAGEPAEHRVIKYDPDECVALATVAVVKLMQDITEFQKTGDINVILYNPKAESCNSIFCPLYSTTSCGGWRNKVRDGHG
jgi:hypothetical protein